LSAPAEGNGRVFYRYIPRRAIIVDSVFIVVLSAAGTVLLLNGVWPLAVVMGIVVLKSLKDLLSEAVIELEDRMPQVVYRRKSVFGTREKLIPAGAIKGASSRIKSMWRGNISEKLVLETENGEYTIHPNSASDQCARGVHSELRRIQQEFEKYQKGLFRAEQRRSRPPVKKVKRLFWAMIEMSVRCPRCETPVPVNGPWNSVPCPGCGEPLELTPDAWRDLLEDVRGSVVKELKPGEGTESTIMGLFHTSLRYARMNPYCGSCKEDFPATVPGEKHLTCSCGEKMELMEPPDWFGGVIRGVRYIAGATRSTEPRGHSPEPVFITCPSCGASFETAGESRNPLCAHCGRAFVIPADLWLHFHPAPVKRRWFAGFTASVTAAAPQD